MLVSPRNPDLYKAWLAYLGSDTALKRTEAFFKSQAGHLPPPTARVP